MFLGELVEGLLPWTGSAGPETSTSRRITSTDSTSPFLEEQNERIGLAGRWWQEEWSGTAWVNGQNLNNKDDGSSPNPNDIAYYSRRDIIDTTSPTGLHYRYTGYLVFDYFITDSNGDTTLQFETGSCYHRGPS